MDDLLRIPCVLMRGGTSKGPFFLASDLPSRASDSATSCCIEIMGSGHPLEIDGIGGGNSLSSKVAIVGPATREGADVDYLFAQVKVEERFVDTSPNCGNMLSAVGPFAIEAGLVPARRARNQGPRPQRQYRQDHRDADPDAGRQGSLSGRRRHRRRARHRGAGLPGLHRGGRRQDRPAPSDRSAPGDHRRACPFRSSTAPCR